MLNEFIVFELPWEGSDWSRLGQFLGTLGFKLLLNFRRMTGRFLTREGEDLKDLLWMLLYLLTIDTSNFKLIRNFWWETNELTLFHDNCELLLLNFLFLIILAFLDLVQKSFVSLKPPFSLALTSVIDSYNV